MAKQNNKALTKPFRKIETMDNSMKSPSFSKDGSSGIKIKAKIPHSNKMCVGVLAPDVTPKTYLGKCYEDQQIKLKLLELAPRNPARETSEGVQQFIKQVSNFIEKKNPFKDKVTNTVWETERNIDPFKFNMTNDNLQNNRKLQILGQETFVKNNEITRENGKSYLEKLESEKADSAVSSPKKNSERISQGKKNKSGISVRKKDQKEFPPKNKKNAELKRVITLNENPIFLYENERTNHATHCGEKKSCETSTNKQNQTKKKKRSEIPLRKSRKPFSTLLKKPLESVASNFSIDLFPKKKPSSPVKEISLCSEIQVIISAVGSSEKLSESGKISDCESVKKKNSEEYSFGKVKLNKPFKSPDISFDLNPSSARLSDDLSSADKKVKVLDLEKVKTASFTVLRSNTDVFNRLESLHKRNISTKEEKIAAKITSKMRILSPKTSFSSLKEKGSKKNLSFRLSGKGNKLNKKIKGRKKKETEESFHLPKKRSRPKSKTNLDIRNEISETKNACLVSQTSKFDNPKSENLKANQNKERTNRETDSNIPVTIRKHEGKSILRKIAIQKETEELKTHLSPAPISSKTIAEDFPKFEKPKPTRNLACNRKLEKASHRNEKFDEKKNELNFELKCHQTTPRTPPPSPDVCHSVSEISGFENMQMEDDESSSKTIILDNKFNQENNSSWCRSETKTKKKAIKAKSNTEKVELFQSKESKEMTKIKNLGLVIMGRSLNFGKDEPPEKPESSNSSKVKMQLKIDFNSQNRAQTPDDNIKNPETFDWLYINGKKCNEELARQRTDCNDEDTKERIINSNCNVVDSIASELPDEKMINKAVDSVFRKPRKCCSSLKKRTQCKASSVSVKGVRKKKLRSDTENGQSLFSSSLFNSDLSLQNKIKVDIKLKNGVKEENQKDLFEDVPSVKLRRRNSEPHSFKGFVWKRTDFGNPRGLRPSVSSLASSLRHLNTDDIDDFIFWEPVPQKMTSCWEMSLYHFKKPWTVLSCSVFKDNQKSKTPGLILENLRNGGNLNIRQSPINRNERTKCCEENPFDVEPSIAQKNIDIRNWLAALNFPTPPSTSNDVISEGHFSVKSTVDAHNLNKTEACPKRRKVLPNIKFSDETSEKLVESKEKYKTSIGNWEEDEEGHLMELIQRKSGGFVTKEQFLKFDDSVPCSKVTPSCNVYSKSSKEKLGKTDDENPTTSGPKMLKNLETPSRSSILLSEAIIRKNYVLRNQSVGTDEIKEELSKAEPKKQKLCEEKRLRLNLKPFAPEAKVWKFLFIFTLFIAVVHYSFLSSSGHLLTRFNN